MIQKNNENKELKFAQKKDLRYNNQKQRKAGEAMVQKTLSSLAMALERETNLHITVSF